MTAVLKSSVADRDGNRLAPRQPMATRCEPSQRALSRARLAAQQQRDARARREFGAMLDSLDWETSRYVPPEQSAPAPRKAETGPDPLLTAAFVAGVIAGGLAAMMLGARP